MNTFLPHSVLAGYGPILEGLKWSPVRGGFSGASVWCGTDATETPRYAVKAWPEGTSTERVTWIHAESAQAGNLPFVPVPVATRMGNSFIVAGNRIWECGRWMPGTPRETPTLPEIEAAFTAVAQLHRVWPVVRSGPCPAVRNRLRALHDFRTHFAFGPDNGLRPGITYEPLLRRARDAVARVLPWAERALRPWESESLPLQTCIRDLRGEHVLFVGATIGGIVDFGALAQDHVATDLARLLSDFAWEDDERFRLGLEAYRAAGGPAVSAELVRVLTKTGVPCSVVGWLIRLLVEQKPWANEVAAATRLQVLVERAERFTPE